MKQTWQCVISVFTIALVLAGITGLSFQAFRPGGWIEYALGGLWALEVQYPLVAIPATVGTIVLFRAWRRHHLTLGHLSRVPVLFVYGLMGAGAYFIGQYAFNGAV